MATMRVSGGTRFLPERRRWQPWLTVIGPDGQVLDVQNEDGTELPDFETEAEAMAFYKERLTPVVEEIRSVASGHGLSAMDLTKILGEFR